MSSNYRIAECILTAIETFKFENVSEFVSKFVTLVESENLQNHQLTCQVVDALCKLTSTGRINEIRQSMSSLLRGYCNDDRRILKIIDKVSSCSCSSVQDEDQEIQQLIEGLHISSHVCENDTISIGQIISQQSVNSSQRDSQQSVNSYSRRDSQECLPPDFEIGTTSSPSKMFNRGLLPTPEENKVKKSTSPRMSNSHLSTPKVVVTQQDMMMGKSNKHYHIMRNHHIPPRHLGASPLAEARQVPLDESHQVPLDEARQVPLDWEHHHPSHDGSSSMGSGYDDGYEFESGDESDGSFSSTVSTSAGTQFLTSKTIQYAIVNGIGNYKPEEVIENMKQNKYLLPVQEEDGPTNWKTFIVKRRPTKQARQITETPFHVIQFEWNRSVPPRIDVLMSEKIIIPIRLITHNVVHKSIYGRIVRISCNVEFDDINVLKGVIGQKLKFNYKKRTTLFGRVGVEQNHVFVLLPSEGHVDKLTDGQEECLLTAGNFMICKFKADFWQDNVLTEEDLIEITSAIPIRVDLDVNAQNIIIQRHGREVLATLRRFAADEMVPPPTPPMLNVAPRTSSSQARNDSPIYREQNDTTVDRDRNSTHVHHDRNYTHVHHDRNSTHVHHDPTSTHVHHDPTSTHVHHDPTSTHVHHDRNSTHVHHDRNSTHVHHDPTSTHVHHDRTSSHLATSAANLVFAHPQSPSRELPITTSKSTPPESVLNLITPHSSRGKSMKHKLDLNNYYKSSPHINYCLIKIENTSKISDNQVLLNRIVDYCSGLEDISIYGRLVDDANITFLQVENRLDVVTTIKVLLTQHGFSRISDPIPIIDEKPIGDYKQVSLVRMSGFKNLSSMKDAAILSVLFKKLPTEYQHDDFQIFFIDNECFVTIPQPAVIQVLEGSTIKTNNKNVIKISKVFVK